MREIVPAIPRGVNLNTTNYPSPSGNEWYQQHLHQPHCRGRTGGFNLQKHFRYQTEAL